MTKKLLKKGIDEKLTILDHALELKNTAIKILISWVIATAVAFYFYEEIFQILLQPLNQIGKSDTALLLLRPVDGFMVIFKVSGFTGLIFSLPLILWFLWKFISPAFKASEKRFISGYIFSILLFSLVGILYGYYSIIPGSLNFLLNINPAGTTASLTVNDYLDYLVFLLFSLILVFQTPILVFSMILSRLVKPKFFSERRRYVYLIIIIILAILTPTPDVFTLAMITVPVLMLFEGSLLLSRFLVRKDVQDKELEE
jgi:sec-independent protein translocase protein TatC